MAEGLFRGVLGGEEGKPELEMPEALACAEAFAAAVAALMTNVRDSGVVLTLENTPTTSPELFNAVFRAFAKMPEEPIQLGCVWIQAMQTCMWRQRTTTFGSSIVWKTTFRSSNGTLTRTGVIAIAT